MRPPPFQALSIPLGAAGAVDIMPTILEEIASSAVLVADVVSTPSDSTNRRSNGTRFLRHMEILSKLCLLAILSGLSREGDA